MPLDPDLTDFTTASPTIASYDFENIASGEGFITFYLLFTGDDAGVTRNLITSPFYSQNIETTQATTATVNWDTSGFNLTRTVSGTAYFNFGVQASTTGSNETFTVTLQKWDGTTGTNITAAHTKTIGSTATTQAFKMPCTETIINRGEQLRLRITITIVGGGENITYGHDPQNRDGTVLTPSSENTITSSRINVPFKVDV